MKIMLRLTWIEFFLRVIPETFILVYGIHVVARKRINITQYIFFSIILSISIFFVRCLPIYFGVHTMICAILDICIAFIIGVPLIRAVCGTFLVLFILSLSESLNMIILSKLNLNADVNILEPFTKCLYGLPSMIFLLLSIILIKYLLKMKERLKNVSY